MKKIIGYSLAALILLLSPVTANASSKCTNDMLTQLTNINISWRPIIGNSLYTIERKNITVVVIKLYDNAKIVVNPEQIDLQAIFIKTNKSCTLAAIIFSSIDVTEYINLLTKLSWPAKE